MKRLLIFLQMLIAFAAGVSAQETLTVCDGTDTNASFPFYGYANMDGAQKSQMLYAADGLSAMNGKKITSITFYPTGTTFGWADNGAPENVWNLAEVDNASFTSAAFISAEFTNVATTKGVRNADNSWTITFTTPYVYNGGNLLIQGEMPQGNNGNQTFYGANQANNMSYVHYEDNYGGDSERSKFSPKVTFTYEEEATPGPGGDSTPSVATFDIVANPWNHAVSDGTDKNRGNFDGTENFLADDGATSMTFTQGTGTTTCIYNSAGNHLRLYPGSTAIITAPAGKLISKVDLEWSGTNNGSLDASTTLAEPSATYTLAPTTNARLTKITVTLVPGSTPGGGDNGEDTGDDVIPAGYSQMDDFAYSFEDIQGSGYSVYFNKANAPLGWDYLGSSQSIYSRTSSGHTGGYGVYTYTDYSTKTADQNYYIITPMVKGDVKIWAKAYSSYASYDGTQMVKAYKVTKNEDGTFSYPTDDDLLTSVNLGLNTTYQQITLAEGLTKYTYIAIALSRAYVDDLTATSALMPENPGLEVTAFTSEWTDANPLYADAEGKATYTAKFKVKNVGNVDLVAGRDNYSVTVVSQSTGSVTIPETIIPISVDLAQGEESQEIELNVECTIVNLENGDGRTAIRVTSNLLKHGTTATTTANYKQSSWFTVKNLAPKLIVKEGSNDLTSNALSFGIVSGQGTKTISLKNDGGSTLHITSVTSTIDNGFSFNAPLPFVIEKGETREATISIGGTEGFKSGAVTFTYDNGKTLETKAISATVVNADTYLETFNSGIPATWVNEEGSSWTATTQSTNGWVQSSTYSPLPTGMLISPKIAFADGQTLTVAATARGSQTGNDNCIQIYYSTDRKNWTPANVLAFTAEKASTQDFDSENVILWQSPYLTGVNDVKTYVLNGIPAGEWYIGFRSGYALIDHIFGGKLATVENDMYVNPLAVVAGKAMVNYPVTATVSYKNMNTTDAAAHTITLYDGDEVIATENVATLAATTSKSVDFTFTPHAAGVHNLKAIVAVDGADYSVETAVEAINILAEEMPAEAMAGTRTSSTNGYVPFHTYYTYNRSEWIWTADKMPDLSDGDVISNISFPFYNTDKDVTIGNVKLYLVNVDDATFATSTRTDLTDLEPVFSATDFVLKKEGSSSSKAMMEINLDENFTYTGGNIKAIFIAEELTNKASYSSTNARFEYYSASNAAMYVCNSTESYYLSNNPTRTSYVPVAVLGLVAEAPVLSGTISDKGVAIADATVEAKSGNVVYTATTDADGNYSMEIMQPTLTYVVTVTADGYDPFVSEAMTIAEDTTLDHDFIDGVILAVNPTVGYATFFDSTHPVKVPAGAQAYVFTQIPGMPAPGIVEYSEFAEACGEEFDGVIPANEPVVIKGEGNVALEYADAPEFESFAEFGANYLWGTDEAMITPVPLWAEDMYEADEFYYYALSLNKAGDADSAGFYWMNATGAPFMTGAHKAYLAIPQFMFATDAKMAFRFDEDVTTGIKNVNVNNDSNVYNLQGQRVGANQKGIVIVNGRKYVRK